MKGDSKRKEQKIIPEVSNSSQVSTYVFSE